VRETTVAEIAERAGLTDRMFFRHFADKREVLFGGQDALQLLFVDGILDAPEAMAPLDAVGDALPRQASPCSRSPSTDGFTRAGETNCPSSSRRR
jgi:AcrR family transcriptional regulator